MCGIYICIQIFYFLMDIKIVLELCVRSYFYLLFAIFPPFESSAAWHESKSKRGALRLPNTGVQISTLTFSNLYLRNAYRMIMSNAWCCKSDQFQSRERKKPHETRGF